MTNGNNAPLSSLKEEPGREVMQCMGNDQHFIPPLTQVSHSVNMWAFAVSIILGGMHGLLLFSHFLA